MKTCRYDFLEQSKFVQDVNVIKMLKADAVKTEMVGYLLEEIKKEFSIENDIDAYMKWEEYKVMHGIV